MSDQNNEPLQIDTMSPYVLMSHILEKLRLLNYTQSLPALSATPLTPFYFISSSTASSSSNRSEQFKVFVMILSWLLRDYLKVPVREFDLYMEDPLSVSTEVVDALQNLNLSVNHEHLSPMKLRSGSGQSVLNILYAVLDLVLRQQNFTFGKLIYPKNIEYVEDEENVEDDDENNIIDDTYGMNQDGDDEDEEYMTYYTETAGPEATGAPLAEDDELLENQVDPEEWALELEQVESQLVLRLQPDHKDWRYHVDSMIQKHGIISENYEFTSKSLTKLSDEISKVVDRIKKRESMLSQDHSLHSLLGQYKNNQDKLEKVTKTYKDTEENIGNLSNELNTINQELHEVKARLDQLSKQMGDTTPLQEIKKSQVAIKKEIREMDLRAGVLQHKLLQAKQKSMRAMSAENSRAMRDAAYSDLAF
mmetsp:Transcript_7856/g.29407  ORF Transcript_7856/g.29407 Transcript_7856/m.29407 type:complete len:420 (-) Transcript_7856:124-1383(-)